MSGFEKYLKPRYILTYSGLHYLQSALSFCVTILLARIMGKTHYGYFTYGMVFFNTLSTLNQFGTEKTLIRDLIQKEKPGTVLISATTVNLMISFIALLGIAIWTFFFSDNSGAVSVTILACAMAGTLLGLSPMAWFDFKGHMRWQASLSVAERVVYLGLAAGVIFFWRDNAVAAKVAMGLLIARALASIVEWMYVKQTIESPLGDISAGVRNILRDNVWVWLADIGNLLMTQVNQIILKHQAGPEELALYGFSFQTIMLIRLLQRQMMRLTAPSIASVTGDADGSYKEAKRKMFRYCGLTLGLTLVVVMPLYFLAPTIIRLLVGVKYLDAVPTLNVLLLWISIFGIALINNQFLLGLRLQRVYFWSTLSFGVLSVVLAWVLVPTMKSQGAALSLLIAHFLSIIVQFILVLNKMNKGHATANS